MRQSFDIQGGAHLARANLGPLRDAMRAAEVDGLYIPHEDEYHNETPPAYNRRLTWASGFHGSAGAAIVLADSAHLFVDGRYALQASMQVDTDLYTVHDLTRPGPGGWLGSNGTAHNRIGFDPRVVSSCARTALADGASASGAQLVALSEPIIDAAWTDRPCAELSPILPHGLAHAGRSSANKRALIAAHLRTSALDHLIVTSPISVAWLFNIRSLAVPHCPAPLARAIVDQDGSARLFLDPGQMTDTLRTHLGEEVSLIDLAELEQHLRTIGTARAHPKRVSLDPADASCWFLGALGDAQIVAEPDPCALPRACKNEVELDGARLAHRQDGAALVRFLCWLDARASSGTITEIDAVKSLEGYREETGVLRDIAFPTIAGGGPHGAIIHYRVDEASNRRLRDGDLFLVDSGGQYDAGTTDVTRTVAIGPAGAEERRMYTLVLRSHLALAMARFPADTPGLALDAIARAPMWAAGLDYAHGTGHGVGAYLNVHEGPQKIARQRSGQALLPGMIVSNEPGYYKPGAFGIRIENLQIVTEATGLNGGETDMLGFEVLTLAPYARDLIDVGVLSAAERTYIDAYHARVRSVLSDMVDDETRNWLAKTCTPLSAD